MGSFKRDEACALDAPNDRSRQPYRHANELPYQVERTNLQNADAKLLEQSQETVWDMDIDDYAADLETLCRRYGVQRLELFGSAAAASFDDETSDLDFLVEFGHFASGEYANAYFGLLEELERLFGRPVDLVVDSAIRNPYFRESVQRNKRRLYGT